MRDINLITLDDKYCLLIVKFILPEVLVRERNLFIRIEEGGVDEVSENIFLIKVFRDSNNGNEYEEQVTP